MNELHAFHSQLAETQNNVQQATEKILRSKPGLQDDAGCWACEIGLNATIGGILAAIAVATAPEAGFIAAVCAATGLGVL